LNRRLQSFQSASRQQELGLHPTVKPVAMIADAIKDVSNRSGIVLDCFGGSGSTLIACPSRKSYPRVAMMQSEQDRCGDDGPRSLDGSS
jgi:hypothetical protein